MRAFVAGKEATVRYLEDPELRRTVGVALIGMYKKEVGEVVGGQLAEACLLDEMLAIVKELDKHNANLAGAQHKKTSFHPSPIHRLVPESDDEAEL